MKKLLMLAVLFTAIAYTLWDKDRKLNPRDEDLLVSPADSIPYVPARDDSGRPPIDTNKLFVPRDNSKYKAHPAEDIDINN